LIVIICSILLTLLGLVLTTSTMTEFASSTEAEAREQALLAADAGFNSVKASLRGKDLTEVLAATTTVNQYIAGYPVPEDEDGLSYFNRNPMAAVEAVNVNFETPPAAVGTRDVNGLLTPPEGVVVGTGRYFAKISDNDDGDANPLVDADGEIVVRVMGVHRSSAAETQAYGTRSNNAVAIIEASLRRDVSFDFSSPFTVAGPCMSATISGGSFRLDGAPHDIDGNPIAGTAEAGLSLINNNPGGLPADAGCARSTACSVMGSSASQITGDTGECSGGASIQDDTGQVRSSPNEDAKNIFDPNWMASVINRIGPVADRTLSGGHYSGIGAGSWGTPTNPEITVIEGDLTVTGSGSGAGILVVKGDLDVGGAFDFTGLVLVTGGTTYIHGVNKEFVGGIFTADIVDNGDGTYSYGSTNVDIRGKSLFAYSGAGISLGYSLLPMKTIAWREITREIEPY
jgi:hypothetical protein